MTLHPPHDAPRRTTFLAAAALALAACAPEAPREPAALLSPPTLKVSEDPAWTGLAAGDAVVARAGGLPIPADRFRRALREAGPGADPRGVLDLLVDLELLAQAEAREAPEGGIRPTLESYRTALVARFLRKHFVEDLPPEAIPEGEVAGLFKIPQVWARYNHHRIFRIQDYQWICCGGGPSECGSPEGLACFEEGAKDMARLLEALRKDPPESVDIPLLTERWRSVAPRLTYQAYDFVWDEKERMQKGAIVFDEAVVDAVVRTAPAHFASRIVRSRFGWHLLYVKETQPASWRDFSDPQVRLEIASFYLTRFQQRRVAETLVSLVPVHGFRMLEQAFPMGPPPGVRPKYDAAVYPDALAEAIEATERRKEEEPL